MNLVELSTQYEGLDNIVAFWDPEGKTAADAALPFRLHALLDARDRPEAVAQQSGGHAGRASTRAIPQRRQFAIDFGGPKLSVAAGKRPAAGHRKLQRPTRAIVENQVFHNPFDNTWRVMLKLEPKPGNNDPVDLRCTLKKGEEVLSETWTYLWSPP